MKFLHTADLHIGKRVNEISLLEDQAYILKEILRIAREREVDGILVAGDVYDKAVPSAEAVQLLDDFVTRAVQAGIPLYLISGNHDSAQRLAFGARLMRPPSVLDKKTPQAAGVYISPVYDGTIEPVVCEDAHGRLNLYLIPFLKPVEVRRFFPEQKIETYQEAFAAVIGSLQLNVKERNLCVAHQLIIGARRADSEELSVGGVDQVDAELLAPFDYAALGHIHRPQQMRANVRYCGTPLKYSFSEANDQKAVTIVELGAKGEVQIFAVPLKPLHDMREIRGKYEDITLREHYAQTETADYLHITLTDEEDVPHALGKLRAIYPNLLKLDYDNRRTRENQILQADIGKERSPEEYFAEFYRLQNNQEMSKEQQNLLRQAIEEVWEA